MTGFTYKSYSFIDKDPILDEIRTIVQSSGATYTYISATSGVSKNTLSNWFGGKTKRPQAASINAVLRALGYRLAIVQWSSEMQSASQTASLPPKKLMQITKYQKAK